MDQVPVDRAPAPGVVLLSGIPGSGKSTVAAALAARFAAAAHIEVDGLQSLIVSGGRWPTPEGDPEADRQIFLRARNACLLADSFAAAGFLPVIDDVVVRRSHLDFYRASLRTAALHPVFLVPGPAKARERNDARHKRLTTDWSFLHEAMLAELPDVGVRVDSAELTVEETVDAVLAAAGLSGAGL
ncbi:MULTISPECIES: AAA family ATPase [unclassified Streptomyces]|uniref:AAA family ATPase n=1 Tax=unclassified Streptomyces TaxID=2593676 RepID=UPI0016603792|nr:MULTISPECIES: AAA family ATPase [unclassified Streptomyces]MBD0709789.1 phosphotransferase [Streptomyces sp. CBMA291]MBD0717694.1 phosphotransferase [Streptomyces sp. CBMA370]